MPTKNNKEKILFIFILVFICLFSFRERISQFVFAQNTDITTGACTAGFGLTAITSDQNKVELSWVACSGNYKILRAKDRNPTPNDLIFTSNEQASSYLDTITESATYYYQVCLTGNNTCSVVAQITISLLQSPFENNPINGSSGSLCGPANGEGFTEQPSSDLLCVSGSTASIISGSGPWTWVCSTNTATSSSCRAELLPECNDLDSGLDPSNLCKSGVSGILKIKNNQWIWTCTVTGSIEESIACSTQMDDMTLCGPANGQNSKDLNSHSQDLCGYGSAVDFELNDSTNEYTWICSYNNETESCSANKPIDGQCGASNNGRFGSVPDNKLCTFGSSTDVILNGNAWTWTCDGLNGGIPVSCSANKATDLINGVCGPSSKGNFSAIPSTGLCTSGTSSVPSMSENTWVWKCIGSNEERTVSCSASKKINGHCGSSNGKSFATSPASDLCVMGTATKVVLNGNVWTWDCAGINTGTAVSCSAQKSVIAVNGECGSAKGGKFALSPSGQLCSKGNASTIISKNGLWVWTCVGLDGGTTASCSANIKYCAYEYEDWSQCKNGKQTRSIKKPEPKDCIATSYLEPLTRDCSTECTYNYTEGECVNNIMKRKLKEPIPQNCTNNPILEIKCPDNQLVCESSDWKCGDWGECQASGYQSRACKLVSKCDAVNGGPETSQKCEYKISVSTASNKPTPSIPSSASGNKEIVSIAATSDNLNIQCIEAGIKNTLVCNTYLAQMNIVKECLLLGRNSKAECRLYLFDRYGNPIKCEQFKENLSREAAAEQCNIFIDNVILADLEKEINDETIKELETYSGQTASFDTANQVIKVIDKNNQEQRIKIEESPLANTNNEIKISLTPIVKIENSTTKSPVAIIFDENQNGIPDEVEKRNLGVDPKDLTGVDKALATGKSLEQPKDSQNIGAALDVEVENTENALTFKGKAYPNQIISLFIYSSIPIIVTVKADENGNWVYDLDKGLSDGKHEVYVAINDSEGRLLEASIPKLFFVAEARAVELDDYLALQPVTMSNFTEKSDSIINNYIIGGIVIILVLIVSFFLIKKIAINKYE